MNRLTRLMCTTALATMFVGMAHSAFALTIMDSLSPVTTGVTSTDFAATLNLGGFTASGGTGTLTGVTVTLTDNVSGIFSAQNTTGASRSLFSGYLENILSITAQPSNLALPTIIDQSNGTGFQTVAANTTFQDSTLTGSAFATVNATGSLANFLLGWSIGISDVGFDGGLSQSGIAKSSINYGNVTIAVTYTYDATVVDAPEPASLALLGAGLASIGLVRRRRSKV